MSCISNIYCGLKSKHIFIECLKTPLMQLSFFFYPSSFKSFTSEQIRFVSVLGLCLSKTENQILPEGETSYIKFLDVTNWYTPLPRGSIGPPCIFMLAPALDNKDCICKYSLSKYKNAQISKRRHCNSCLICSGKLILNVQFF